MKRFHLSYHDVSCLYYNSFFFDTEKSNLITLFSSSLLIFFFLKRYIIHEPFLTGIVIWICKAFNGKSHIFCTLRHKYPTFQSWIKRDLSSFCFLIYLCTYIIDHRHNLCNSLLHNQCHADLKYYYNGAMTKGITVLEY